MRRILKRWKIDKEYYCQANEIKILKTIFISNPGCVLKFQNNALDESQEDDCNISKAP